MLLIQSIEQRSFMVNSNMSWPNGRYVHPQNAFEYSEALVQADKDFKENLYTNRNHGIYGGNTRNHLLRQVTEWFIENL